MVKVIPDDQDIAPAADGGLDFSKAKPVVSTYDLNAIEVAVRLAADTGAHVSAVSVGTAKVDDSKTKKNILSRGVDELHMVADDAFDMADAHRTASALASIVRSMDAVDLIVCGDGSADLYAQQTDVQLAEALGCPVMNGVVAVKIEGSTAVVERVLETERETIVLPLPAVISVSPDAAVPRIAGMKDILAAGKKPSTLYAAGDVAAVEEVLETVEVRCPEPAPRKKELFNAAEEGALEKFAAALASAL